MAAKRGKKAKRAASRRRFLRGLGLAAAGITGAAIARENFDALAAFFFGRSDAKARVKHHLHELQKALRDSYPTMQVTVNSRYEGGLPALVINVIPPEQQFVPPPETAIG